MNNKKQANIETDWQHIAQSMHDSPGTILEKLKSIWELAAYLIRHIEGKYPTPTKEILSRRHRDFKKSTGFDYYPLDLGKFKLRQSSLFVVTQKLDGPHESLIATAYFGALGAMGKIQITTDKIRPFLNKFGESFRDDADFIDEMLTGLARNSRFLHEVVPLFFSLQLYCRDLIEIANRPAGAPADPAVRKKRARMANAARNYGEDELKSRFISFFDSQNRNTKFKSIPILCNALWDDLEKILENYKGLIGLKIDGKTVNYGETLTIAGIQKNKLRSWAQEDPKFKESLQRICILKQNNVLPPTKIKATPYLTRSF